MGNDKEPNIHKLVSAIPHNQVKARDRMKAVIHLWKGDWSMEDLCKKNKVTQDEIIRWSKLAHYGAVNALRIDRLKNTVRP